MFGSGTMRDGSASAERPEGEIQYNSHSGRWYEYGLSVGDGRRTTAGEGTLATGCQCTTANECEAVGQPAFLAGIQSFL